MQGSPHYRFGHDVLGPIFAAFACLLLRQARADKIEELAFVARDGYLLMQATKHLIAGHADTSFPQCSYVHLSRISTALPACNHFTDELLAESLSIRAGTPTIATQLAYFGIDVHALQADIIAAGFDPAMHTKDIAPLRTLLSNPDIRHAIDMQRCQKTERLENYLLQQHILGNPACALVDIGWRGSILAALSQTFGTPDAHPLRCYYFGYWHENGVSAPTHGKAQGIISDYTRSRHVLEGAAYFMGLPLEAICRADHGTTLGYTEQDGKIVPTLQTGTSSTHRESAQRKALQAGLLGYIDTHAQTMSTFSSQALRRKVQWRLLRLAFLPAQEEIACITELEHNEGHNAPWRTTLIQATRPLPWSNPGRWLAGLASPWRGGYVVATGGRLLGFAYLILETLLAALPSGVRRRLREQALRISTTD